MRAITASGGTARDRLGVATARVLARHALVPRAADVVPALGVTLGVILALWLAMWLQLQSPFWAGSTVVITYQATRGQSLMKGVNRLIGTAVGTTASIGLIALFPQQWWGYVLVHTLWLVACTALACWLTQARAYAAALSGYTALIVAFDSFGAPQDAFETALSRGSSICVGVLVFTVLFRVLEPSRDAASVRHTLTAWHRDGLTLLAGLLGGHSTREDLARHLARLADLDGLLEEGTLQAIWVGRSKPLLRGGVLALADALMLAASAAPAPDNACASQPPLPPDIEAKVHEAAAAFAVLRAPHGGWPGPRVGRAVDHDWQVVARGALRSTGCFGLACAIWIVTRWPSGSTFAAIAGILCGLFSFRPAAIVVTRSFVAGTIAAALVAIWIGLFVLPDVGTFEALAAILFPFLFVGALGVRMPALSGYTAPFNLLFLSMMGIRNVMSYDALSVFNAVEATVAGALWAAFWYRVCPPLTAAERLAGLRRRLRRGAEHPVDTFHGDAARRLLYLQRLGQVLRLAGPAEARTVLDRALRRWRP